MVKNKTSFTQLRILFFVAKESFQLVTLSEWQEY